MARAGRCAARPDSGDTVGMQSSSYARLPPHFYARLAPTPVAKPRLIQFNRALSVQLGLGVGGLDDDSLAAIFSGNQLPDGVEPIATAYAGHQFGYFVPQLGDGRAILIGEARDQTGALRDIQLKGSGRTPFSRNGDGRAALGPVLREYLVSEAMHALGIPTTRSLAAVLTGEFVIRDQRLPGAIGYVCTPFMQPFHGYPSHFQNFTHLGHKRLFERAGFEVKECGTCVGPGFAVSGVVASFIGHYAPRILRWPARAAWFVVSGVLLHPLDRWLAEREDAYAIASTTYVLIAKPNG